MIRLSARPSLARKALVSSGGFLWWYLDIIDKNGNGLVLIWSFGLPFLPGYASSARKAQAPIPKHRPSITLSIYKEHVLDFYLLQELSPEEATWDEHKWQFGETHIHAQDKTLKIDLCVPIPASPHKLTGSIHIEGTTRKQGETKSNTDHEWVPILMPAHALVSLKSPIQNYQFSGRAYHDHNSGLPPLHELNIDRWWWGRLALPDRELIWYSLFPKDESPPIHLSITINEAGETLIREKAQCETHQLRWSPFGLSWPTSFSFLSPWDESIHVQVNAKVDDGPFYQRFTISCKTQQGQGHGFAEHVVPDCVDGDWMRPLVRMRVMHPQKNSFWLPLFTGPKKGRISRLFQQLYR